MVKEQGREQDREQKERSALPDMLKPGLLAGKRYLVTGGGTGLGKVMAEGLASLGADIVICGRRKGVLEETAQAMAARHKVRVDFFPVDIRVAAAVEEMVEAIWRQQPLDGLVNNAAGNFISPTRAISPKGFDAIANIVFHGTFYMTLACGKRWIEEKRPASVVSILTTWVWNGGPFTVPSAMAKAGIHIMTKSLAAEWGRYQIRLNAIAPGPFPTEGAWARLSPGRSPDDDQTGVLTPWGRNGQMHELANLAAFLLAPGCDYLTGQTIAIDGGGFAAGGGNFYSMLKDVDEEGWAQMRDRIRSANEKDKAARSV